MLKQSNFFNRNIDMTWKTFVRESHDVPDLSSETREHRLGFEGSQAKEAYEEIIRPESAVKCSLEKHKNCKLNTAAVQKNTIVKSIIPKEKGKSNQNPQEKVSINAILKAVEQKDLKFLVKHMTQENVNLTDDFGWTPLMSAAYCGHLDIIEFLLSLGANKETREKSGLTAAQLALKKNYLNIVALLKKKTASRINKIPPKIHTDNLQIKTDGFYCEICKISFHQTTWKKHETSTLHIFNTKPKLPNAMYGISRQNKGYQILLNSGWDDQAGLGPSGKGIKYPIKTCLKTDRKGLGQSNDKEYRVTHFKPGDLAAVNDIKSCKQKCLKKKDREKLLHREVRKERALRIALS
ncbi:G patch domain and ankyrin repeat-containing protein 1 like protein [Dufourea novaeangliae]|uniref:G patch domain and ankyrin repeat-containing protein 1 like protein n=1 Tax=Dufourea novaeangliae TaxID=178035 RepID=A0A154PGR3_DUFNO|nr:G patch domain and ankyrin repeat-containing protein 1 like protein [Dufourea novaeangliae]